MWKRWILCCSLLIFPILLVVGQNVSNEGRDFWAVFPSHDQSGSNLANITLFVTSKFNTEATVTCGSFSKTLPIAANTSVPFNVPRNSAYVSFGSSNGVLLDQAIRVTVPLSQPKVAVYAHIYAGARSAASLILPFEALGQSYYSINYTQSQVGPGSLASSSNFLVLIAAEDNTDLIIHSKSGTKTKVSFKKAGEMYQYTEPNFVDLTGTYVEVDPVTSACKRFAAFSGSTSLSIQCTGSLDPLYQQLYALNSWGKNYGIVPFSNRKYRIRILARNKDTQVKFNGRTIVLQPGAFFESQDLTQALFVSANEPICVAQYALTQACSGSSYGDPEMVILNPVEFGLKKITMFSSDLQEIVEKYVNVYMKTSGIGEFKLNGAAPSVNWSPMPSDPEYSYIQIPVIDQSLTLSARETFNATAYGFGNFESYGYSAGTSLAAFQFLSLKDVKSGAQLNDACSGATYSLAITIPVEASKITWKFLDGSADFIDTSPVSVKSMKEDQTLYTYTYSQPKSFSAVGNTQVIAVVESPSGSGCSAFGETEYRFDLAVNPIPSPDFTFDKTACNGQKINFTDKSESNSATVELDAWFWDFGDGSTSAEQNPSHIYKKPGNYEVTLSAGASGGCFGAPKKYTISVYPTPEAKFIAKSNLCVGLAVILEDQSTVDTTFDPNSKVVEWRWDFGDGSTTAPQSTNRAPAHAYSAPGPYTVTLTVVSDKGCVSNPVKVDVKIVSLPVADFELPGFCLADKYALFTNQSRNSDGTSENLSYLWNFGDPGSPENESADVNGKHQYTKTGNYTVSLTIRNLTEGCSVTVQKSFTVNGSVDVADFDIKNRSECVSSDIIINNRSTAFVGSITKIDVYKDYLNNPAEFVTIDNPTAGDIHLKYPDFGGNSAKEFSIRLVAYSGEALTCQKEVTKVVTVLPTPQLTFSAQPAVCINDGNVTISTAMETSGMLGTGNYSGTGISPAGLFNPLTAGVGKHAITYTFTSTNGCTASVTQTIEVFESPNVDAGEDLNIFEGGELQFKASTTTSGALSYKWSPAAGLDRDDILNPVVRPTDDAVYTLTVTNQNGCTATDQVRVTVLKEIHPFNTFSPNGDGINDVWNLPYINSYPKVTVEIFNRNGARVFFSQGYTVPFDGKYKGQPLPVGTYYYLIQPGSGRKPIAGDVTIIR